MSNEVLLIIQLVFLYFGVLLAHQLFGKVGLYCFTVFAVITANIEVLLQIDAFGMQMSMGNVLFASTFLITDLLSEIHGKDAAKKCVYLGMFTSALFALTTVIWKFLTVNELDFAFDAFGVIFSNTPRLVLTSLSVYFIAQLFDVWLYHKIWETTNKKFGGRKGFLWLRNNGSTLCSQFVNNVLFTTFAFVGIFTPGHMWEMIVASYVIFIFTSLLDTPVVYLVRRMNDGNSVNYRN